MFLRFDNTFPKRVTFGWTKKNWKKIPGESVTRVFPEFDQDFLLLLALKWLSPLFLWVTFKPYALGSTRNRHVIISTTTVFGKNIGIECTMKPIYLISLDSCHITYYFRERLTNHFVSVPFWYLFGFSIHLILGVLWHYQHHNLPETRMSISHIQSYNNGNERWIRSVYLNWYILNIFLTTVRFPFKFEWKSECSEVCM